MFKKGLAVLVGGRRVVECTAVLILSNVDSRMPNGFFGATGAKAWTWSGVGIGGMVWYGMVWYGMVWYGMVWYGMVWNGMEWNGTIWNGMVRYDMVWAPFVQR